MRPAGGLATVLALTAVVVVTTSGARAVVAPDVQTVPIRVDSRIGDVTDEELEAVVISTLQDARGWKGAGFEFVISPDAPYEVVLAEPGEVDRLCSPLGTGGRVSCQNGPVVALNAERWRHATSDWDLGTEQYRRYVVNHEVGHLIGQRHPTPRCPVKGTANAVMEQQTKGLAGCSANVWPLSWEIERAAARPVVFAPPPDWAPDPVPRNLGGAATTSVAIATTTTAAPVTEPVATTVVAVAPTEVPTTAPTTASDPAGATTPASGEADGATADTGADRRWPIALALAVPVGAAGSVVVARRRRRAPDGTPAAVEPTVELAAEPVAEPAVESAVEARRWETRQRTGDATTAGRTGTVLWVAADEDAERCADLLAEFDGDPSTADALGSVVTDIGGDVGLLSLDPTGAVVAVCGRAVAVLRRHDGRIAHVRDQAVRLRVPDGALPVRITLALADGSRGTGDSAAIAATFDLVAEDRPADLRSPSAERP